MPPLSRRHRFRRKIGAKPPIDPATGAALHSVAMPEIPADIIEFGRMLHFEPDPIQLAILQSRTKQGIINGSRQIGKSTLLALMAVHRALTEPKSLVLLVGPFNRQAGELLEKVKDFIEDLGMRAPGDGRHRNSIRLPNRSRIIAVPAVNDRVRCFSAVKLLIIDEAAFVNDETYKRLRPTLAVSEGDMWLISTPLGRRGFFYKVWTEGGDDWEKFAYPASECPRIPAKFLAAERAIMTESEYQQEFCCGFVDPNAALFRLDVILAAIDPTVERLIL